MSGITIVTPGPLTTVQDIGRFGYLGAGVCPSGVMDKHSAMIASALVGNSPGYDGDMPALLEMSMQGATLRFDEPVGFAITGAAMNAKLNGESIPNNICHEANAGDELEVGYAQSGCRAYLAFRGGIDVPLVMGSRSTHIKAKFGGFGGRRLMRGDVVPLLRTDKKPPKVRHAANYNPYSNVIRVTDGPQMDMFNKSELNKFTANEYTVSVNSDRMGVRMDGEPIAARDGGDIISDGIPMGAVQVSNGGQPMILMNDRQTTGGYAKPYVVIEADLSAIAQLRPGDRVRFEYVTIRKARLLTMEQNIFMGTILRRIEDDYKGEFRLAGFTLRR